ncbi:galanin receptor 2b-like [Hydractinia symbiolongicarpus]|uniref:galanin receptor 2b-like n=1 Tax=Hydractinia symbiolongicarpus TaxID=13093 RepID=UPI00254EADCF|nr:galanin receptor 2b-like [Hydractinia symbiolongicarpus]
MTGSTVIIELVGRLLAMLLHILGLYLLQNSRYNNENQKLLLTHLSLSEVLLCLSGALKHVLTYLNADTAAFYVFALKNTGFSTLYYFMMLALTVDRFCEFYLNIRYPIIWNSTKTKYIMGLIWGLSTLFCLVIVLYIPSNSNMVYLISSLYVYPGCEILCMVAIVFTYGYLFTKLRKSRRVRHTASYSSSAPDFPSTTSGNSNSKIVIKKPKRFFVPTLIISTFLIFMLLPDQIYFYLYLRGIEVSSFVHDLFAISYCIAYASDAIVYIFLSSQVRMTLLKKIRLRNYTS